MSMTVSQTKVTSKYLLSKTKHELAYMILDLLNEPRANEFIEVLETELTWSKENYPSIEIPSQYKEGFMAGLKQAQFLIKKVAEQHG